MKSGSLSCDGIDCELQLSSGIAPLDRIASNGVVGNAYIEHGELEQSANGDPKLTIDSGLPTIDSNFVTADQSHGGSCPVNCEPIHAPQYNDDGAARVPGDGASPGALAAPVRFP